MSLRYEQPPEQKRFKVDDDGFAYIEEDELENKEEEAKEEEKVEVEEFEKDKRSEYYVRFSSGREVSVEDPENPGTDFKGFLVSGVEAFRHGKKVRGGVKTYTFWKDAKDGSKIAEIYRDQKIVEIKSGEKFSAYCADESKISKGKKKD